MNQRTRMVIAVAILVLIVGAVLGIEQWRRVAGGSAPFAAGQPTLAPGSVPIYRNGQLVGGFAADDLGQVQRVRFVEPAENKAQEGPLLRDVILLRVAASQLRADTTIMVSSASHQKSAQLTWAEVNDPANMVMFDISNRNTLKLISKLPKLDEREEWVQDVDKIEIRSR